MADMLNAMKDEFMGMLNSSAFTTDSVEGWLIILLCLFLIYEISQRAVKFVGWLVCVIFLFQICYWLSFTGLNNVIPLSKFFKYDVLTAVAQCFVGTKICDLLLYANAFIHMVCSEMYNLFAGGTSSIKTFLRSQ